MGALYITTVMNDGVLGWRNAMFRCNHCHQTRKYGNTPPTDRLYEPLLNCRDCQKPTRHTYVELAKEN